MFVSLGILVSVYVASLVYIYDGSVLFVYGGILVSVYLARYDASLTPVDYISLA